MATIIRNPDQAASQHFDIVIIGGGIYGAMLLLQAAQQNQRVLILERNDFGSGTSFNSLRVIHGGLRYLQNLDLVRFQESVAERRWFLQNFPDLVKPLPCMMPLYNQGIMRPGVLRTALAVNDLLSAARNRGVPQDNTIGKGRILSVSETCERFPGVDSSGLSGSALWYDAHAPDTQLIIMETLKWASSLGGLAFNYVEMTDLLFDAKKVVGVHARDRISKSEYEFRADRVINATGPDSRDFSRKFDRDLPQMLRPSRAWNLLFDKPAPSELMLALQPKRQGARTYFLHPWKGRLLAGTGHAPARSSDVSDVTIEEPLLQEFVADMNRVLPEYNLTLADIDRVLAGCLPVTNDGGSTLTKRGFIYDHGRHGGPTGLFSVSGIKFTTSRLEAEKTLRMALGVWSSGKVSRPSTGPKSAISSVPFDWMPATGDSRWKSELKAIVEHESVMHLDDLVYRRTSIGDNPLRVSNLASDIVSIFDWGDKRKQEELLRLTTE